MYGRTTILWFPSLSSPPCGWSFLENALPFLFFCGRLEEDKWDNRRRDGSSSPSWAERRTRRGSYCTPHRACVSGSKRTDLNQCFRRHRVQTQSER